MELTKIEDILARINSLVDGWKSMDAVPAIERDVVLASLRDLYSQLLDMRGDESLAASVAETIAAAPSVEHKPEAVELPAEAEVAAEEVAAETTPAEVAVESAEEPIKSVAEEDPFADIFDIEALLGLSDEERSAPESEAPAIEAPAIEAPEAVVNTPAEVAPASAPIPAPAEVAPAEVAPAPAPAPAPMNMGGGLFDIEDIPVRKKTNRKIISLYNTAPASAPVAEHAPEAKPVEQPHVEPKSEPKPEPTPAPAPAPRPTPRPMPQPTVTEAPKRLGDVLGGGVTTLADKLVDDSQPTPAMSRITDLRKAIGINDKFLMVRDLFDGDVARYEDTIDTLNEFDDLDDCMIYIIENFAWNPDLEGAKLLVSLIERKLA